MPTAIWHLRLRPGCAHCDLALAVEVPHCPLRSGFCLAHCNLPLAVTCWRGGEGGGEEEIKQRPSKHKNTTGLQTNTWEAPNYTCGSRKRRLAALATSVLRQDATACQSVGGLELLAASSTVSHLAFRFQRHHLTDLLQVRPQEVVVVCLRGSRDHYAQPPEPLSLRFMCFMNNRYEGEHRV